MCPSRTILGHGRRSRCRAQAGVPIFATRRRPGITSERGAHRPLTAPVRDYREPAAWRRAKGERADVSPLCPPATVFGSTRGNQEAHPQFRADALRRAAALELVCGMADQRQVKPEAGRIVAGRDPASIIGYEHFNPGGRLSRPRSPALQNGAARSCARRAGGGAVRRPAASRVALRWRPSAWAAFARRRCAARTCAAGLPADGACRVR